MGREIDDRRGEIIRHPEQRRHDAVSPWEWVTAAVGLVLVLGAVGYMLWAALAQPDGPPRIAVEARSVEAVEGRWLVRFRARNAGAETAAKVRLQARLHDGERVVESVETEIDYIPGHSERDGGFLFGADPNAHRLDMVATSYQEP